MSYQRLNTITGWVIFAIATFVYVSTIEPTASFWDCGEFIATAVKLEVGHPPGAPFFLLLGRLFAIFGPGQEAMMINILSALCSSLTILFLFWTITHLAKKLVSSDEPSMGETIAVLGAGAVGALCYTFSDSFWFSAVEGEVYAMSSLFTALVFWAIMKWEAVADKPYANRWLVLIAYLMGLSIGVHLLNLLAIPAITFVYYFRKKKVTPIGLIITGAISIFILVGIQYGIIPMTVKLASQFELFFTNSLGMPFNMGAMIYVMLLIGLIVVALFFTHATKKVVANTAILCVSVILVGYSSFGLILVRSSANPPMDENNPENMFTFLAYLNREQYGDRPLFYGQYFNTPLDNRKPYEDGKPVYYQDKEKGKYLIADKKKKALPNYAKEFSSILPRMYSPDKRHIKEYKRWSKFKGKPQQYRSVQTGELTTVKRVKMSENVRFFLNYQVGWMYMRYFLWNFVGRQNDVQGHGNPLDGNWISGLSFFDEDRVGNEDLLPDHRKENKSRNVYFGLPLLLGLGGLFFQLVRSKKDFLVVTLLFFFTGLAIVIYLNQYPLQPRERDYAYAASFYAYAIWVGLGVLALFEGLRKVTGAPAGAIASTAACLVLVPGIMAKENWDDHDRSNTYTARDFAMNYLDSCEPNAILFTNGDNDTFPLWYVQEVEGYRTDVRVCNLSLLNTDWYIDQMRRAAYDSEPVPFSLKPDQYRQGTRDYVPIVDRNKKDQPPVYIDVKEAMDYIKDPSKRQTFQDGRKMNIFPSKFFSLKVDTNKVLANGTMPEQYRSEMLTEIKWKINKRYVMKNDLMILDLLAHNNWDRPVYFAITTGDAAYIGLQQHFQLEGLAYRLVPFRTKKSADGQTGRVNTEILYKNLMEEFQWGGMESKDEIYMNENNLRMCMNLRNIFARLADALIREGETEKAIEVLDRCMEVMPEHNVPYNFFMISLVEGYYKAGDTEKANAFARELMTQFKADLDFFFDQDREFYAAVKSQAQQSLSVIYTLSDFVNRKYPQGEVDPATAAVPDGIGKEFNDIFQEYQAKFSQKTGLQEPAQQQAPPKKPAKEQIQLNLDQ